jgi:hypothetical protein
VQKYQRILGLCPIAYRCSSQKKAKISLDALARDFEERLNYPETQPATFNSDQLAFNAQMARELATELPDTSPHQSYTWDITLEDIEWVKRHISEHGLDTAVGVDEFSYKDCLEIPNEKLLEFFIYCVKNRKIPQYWLTALLIGILKKDKDPTDPKLPLYCIGMMHAQDAHIDN